MAVYIKGMGTISPQQSWNDEALLLQAFDYRGVVMRAVEPEYENWLDPRQLRRMSRLMKMGIISGLMALRDAEVEVPNGIITGTGYGCLEDTGSFLTRMIENREDALNPTPFIQSTHNTVGSTIAMLLQCQGYNQTFTHGAFSFEHALLDALMYLQETPAHRLLLGGFDEITDVSHTILSRFDVFRKKQASTLNLFTHSRPGTIHGEGSAFFVITGTHDDKCMASVQSVTTLYKPSPQKLRDAVEIFIREAGVAPNEVDLVLLGKSGDRKQDHVLDDLTKQVFPRSNVGLFKHLCGEYPVASSFALWLAARIIYERHIPEVVIFRHVSRPVRHVLILNSNFGTHYSLILVKACRDTI